MEQLRVCTSWLQNYIEADFSGEEEKRSNININPQQELGYRQLGGKPPSSFILQELCAHRLLFPPACLFVAWFP